MNNLGLSSIFTIFALFLQTPIDLDQFCQNIKRDLRHVASVRSCYFLLINLVVLITNSITGRIRVTSTHLPSPLCAGIASHHNILCGGYSWYFDIFFFHILEPQARPPKWNA